MKPSDEARITALMEELGEILHRNTDSSKLTSMTAIELELRRLGQEHLFPPLLAFFVGRATGPATGRPRTLATILGKFHLSQSQAVELGVPASQRQSPYLERCCLVLAAQGSYCQAEKTLSMLMGLTVSDSTIHRTVNSATIPTSPGKRVSESPNSEPAHKVEPTFVDAKAIKPEEKVRRKRGRGSVGRDIHEWGKKKPQNTHCPLQTGVTLDPEGIPLVDLICVDGGKVRIGSSTRQWNGHFGTEWRDYKAMTINGGQEWHARFRDNEGLVARVKDRKGVGTATCIGDGHDGIWNIFGMLPIASEELQREIVDWYHLNENIHKQEWSDNRKGKVSRALWKGNLKSAWRHIRKCDSLRHYLNKHSSRIPNYAHRQAQGLPIGSGSVESEVKQIAMRLKLPGAWWEERYVNQMLDLRTALLNGYLFEG